MFVRLGLEASRSALLVGLDMRTYVLLHILLPDFHGVLAHLHAQLGGGVVHEAAELVEVGILLLALGLWW